MVLGERYRLTRRIATGGMGEVWRATDALLAREVAVKLLKAELVDHPELVERFRLEARHAASLSHPGIAAVYDYGEQPTTGRLTVYLVMELVDGEPLSSVLAREPLLPLPTVLSLLAQAADALAAAHARGVVHRDIKPGNLLLVGDTVKVTDFGIARAIDAVPVTQVGQVVGTPQYMSPEQLTGAAASPASDIYSLGVLGYELLAGHRPFEDDSLPALAMAHLHRLPPPLPASVPRDVGAVIRQALSKNPADRPPDAVAFAAHLRRLASITAPMTVVDLGPRAGDTRVMPADVVVVPRSTTAPSRTRRILPILLAVALIVAAGLVLARIGTGTHPLDPTPPTTVPAGTPTSIQVTATTTPTTQASNGNPTVPTKGNKDKQPPKGGKGK